MYSSPAQGIHGTLKTGGVTVIQRFGSALNLNLHFHTLMMAGVYQIERDGPPIFPPVAAPTDREVAAIVERVFRRIVRTLGAECTEDGAAAANTEPVLASLAGASVAGLVATGPRRGAPSLRVGSGNLAAATIAGRCCATVEGVPLHAAVRARANDRDGLKHLARYLARPPIATERLSRLADGRIMLRFKRPFFDGSEAVVFTPFELIERLLPLIPRPRKPTVRFHGILAPAAGFRSKVVPAPPRGREMFGGSGFGRSCSTMRLTAAGSVTAPTMRIRPWQRGHSRASTTNTREDQPKETGREIVVHAHRRALLVRVMAAAPPDANGASVEACRSSGEPDLLHIRDPEPLEGTSC